MNKVIIVGRLSSEPFNGKTSSGVSYSRFTVAVQRAYQTPTASAPIVDYIPCVAWRQNAEFVNKYLDKGSLILVEGQFQSNRVNQPNNTGITTIYSVQVERVEALETKAAAEQRRKNTGEFNVPTEDVTPDNAEYSSNESKHHNSKNVIYDIWDEEGKDNGKNS